MRIAQLVLSLEVGGLERLAVDLAVQQKSTGHIPIVCCLAGSGPLATELERHEIPLLNLAKPRGASLTAIRRLAAELRRCRVDVVHTHNSVVHHYGVLAARLAGVGVVINSQHGTGSLTVDRKLGRIFRLTMPYTDHVVFVSEQVRRETVAKQRIPERKTSTILNGIPVDRFASNSASPGARLPRIVFGTVGRLVSVKDHRTLIDAFAEVHRRQPQAELRIAGGGPLRQELERQIDTLNLHRAIRLEGEISNVPAFLKHLDVFVLSSVTEALPIAVLEAMAAGLPIVSTRVPGVAEVAPEGRVAIFCEPSMPDELASAMLRSADPTRLKAAGLEAAGLAPQYGIAKVWQRYHELFAKLVSRKAL